MNSLQWRLALASAFAVAILAAARAPAAAADTSYLTLAGPNPYTGPCPATLTFNGSITGLGNSSVTYIWARFVNGQPIDSQPVTTTIPANGTLVLAPQQLVVDQSAGPGLQSYNLFITAPAGSDSGSHGKVYFSVKCQAVIVPHPINLNQVDESTANITAVN